MAKARVRQTWIRGAERFCPHDGPADEIRSYGGVVIAELCSGCGLKLAEYAPCAGCTKIGRLTHFVAATRKAFCGSDCWSLAQRKAREAREPKPAEKTAQRGGE